MTAEILPLRPLAPLPVPRDNIELAALYEREIMAAAYAVDAEATPANLRALDEAIARVCAVIARMPRRRIGRKGDGV